MIKKIRVCDMCGQEIKEKATKVTLMTAFGQKELEQVEGYEGSMCVMDYCMECTGEVTEFLTGQRKKMEKLGVGEEKIPETVVKEETSVSERTATRMRRNPKEKLWIKERLWH